MVRKKMPFVLPWRPSSVRVGDDEAGDTWTTLAGAVTAVRIGIVTDEMMPPMTTGTCLIWTSCVAASTASVPVLCESRVSVTTVQPWAPPAALRSRNAISTDFAPAWPYSPAGPVSSITTPTGIVQPAAWAGRAAASRAASDVPTARAVPDTKLGMGVILSGGPC